MIFKRVHTIPIYNGRLIVAVCDNLQEIADAYEVEADMKGFTAFACDWMEDTGHRVYLIGIRPDASPGVIAHESKHLVNRLFRFIGLQLDANNDEAECYLLGWIVNRASTVLEKYKK